jgi:hypothetical protein
MKRFFLSLAALLVATVAIAPAGPVAGGQLADHRVEAYSTDVFRLRFEGGEAAWVGVVGDGDTELVLSVYDANGHLIASDRGSRCVVAWTPRWTGSFTIKVRNLGSVYNEYRIGAD